MLQLPVPQPRTGQSATALEESALQMVCCSATRKMLVCSITMHATEHAPPCGTSKNWCFVQVPQQSDTSNFQHDVAGPGQ